MNICQHNIYQWSRKNNTELTFKKSVGKLMFCISKNSNLYLKKYYN